MITAVQELKPRTLDRKECIANSATPEPPIDMGRKAIVETPKEMTAASGSVMTSPLLVRMTQSDSPRRRASTRVRARAFSTMGNASCLRIDRADIEKVRVA